MIKKCDVASGGGEVDLIGLQRKYLAPELHLHE